MARYGPFATSWRCTYCLLSWPGVLAGAGLFIRLWRGGSPFFGGQRAWGCGMRVWRRLEGFWRMCFVGVIFAALESHFLWAALWRPMECVLAPGWVASHWQRLSWLSMPPTRY